MGGRFRSTRSVFIEIPGWGIVNAVAGESSTISPSSFILRTHFTCAGVRWPIRATTTSPYQQPSNNSSALLPLDRHSTFTRSPTLQLAISLTISGRVMVGCGLWSVVGVMVVGVEVVVVVVGDVVSSGVLFESVMVEVVGVFDSLASRRCGCAAGRGCAAECVFAAGCVCAAGRGFAAGCGCAAERGVTLRSVRFTSRSSPGLLRDCAALLRIRLRCWRDVLLHIFLRGVRVLATLGGAATPTVRSVEGAGADPEERVAFQFLSS